MKIDGKYYAYGFEFIINKKEFISEWLYEINKKNKKIFERNIAEGKINVMKIKDLELRKKFDVYQDDIRNINDRLFLREICLKTNLFGKYEQDEVTVFRKIYDWIQGLVIIGPSDSPFHSPYYAHLLAEDKSIFREAFDAQKISEMMKSFGTGITDHKVEKCTLEESNLPMQEKERIKNQMAMSKTDGEFRKDVKWAVSTMPTSDSKYFAFAETIRESKPITDEPVIVKTLSFKHGTGYLNFTEESDGTKRLFDLITLLACNAHFVCFIDEMDRSLHPQLTRKFIELFLKNAIDKDMQLIITTHESRLLDLELLRRDEIWFADKNKKGESSLYSLDEYNERFDKKIDKAYLEGRYGSVPKFEEIFPNLSDCDEN
jgi:AAA15 family ATPase/GTPase